MELESHSAQVEIFFFPFVGGGHLIPMIDLARVFAVHGAKSTVLTIPSYAAVLQNSIKRDQDSGLQIQLQTFQLPPQAELQTADMSAPPFTDTSSLQEPLRDLLLRRRPDCIVTDIFHRWAAELIDGIGVPRIVFNGNCCFAGCCGHSLDAHAPHTKVESDSDPFLLPGLPDKIEVTKSQLPIFLRDGKGNRRRAEENSFGVLVNTFYALEPAYVDFYRKEMGKKAWIVGPVSLYNQKSEDKTERGQFAAIDRHSCISWLDSKKPKSVLYVSFGSLARISRAQIHEIAIGLESSGHNFIWVIGKVLDGDDNLDEFRDRMEESKQGLIIRGWAPQLLILEHESVGGFLTHCGWNSTLEGICAGLPMITWPLSAEQFYNENLVTEVLKAGVRVGNEEWASWNMERKTVVGREKVEEAVRRLMGGDGRIVAEMRRRTEELAVEAKKAVEAGGSSFGDVDALIDEISLYIGKTTRLDNSISRTRNI